MTYMVRISHDDLIDMLEDKIGGVYESIAEGDKVTNVELTSSAVTFTIDKED